MGTFNSNQFELGPALGSLSLTSGTTEVMNVQFNPKSTTDQLVAGQIVKLVDLGAEHTDGPPVVDVPAVDEVAFGARVFSSASGCHSERRVLAN